MSGLTGGEPSGYRRVLTRARWSDAKALHLLARLIAGSLPGDAPVVLVGDGTVTSHPGPKVHGKARHCHPIIAWLYARPPQEHRVGGITWAGKRHVTFSAANQSALRRERFEDARRC